MQRLSFWIDCGSILAGYGSVVLKTKKQLLTKPSHSTPEPHPPLVGGPWSSESGRSPNPHRPVLLAGSARRASVEGPESQLAGGGSLRGTHKLLRGPLRAHERRAASTSAARSVRAPLAASVEAKHTLSTAQAGRCSRCAWLPLRQPGARALSARPTCLPHALAPWGATVASGLEPARSGGTAPRGPWVAWVARGGAGPPTAGTGRRKSPAACG